MKRHLLLIALLGLFAFSSCKKGSGPDAVTKTTNINDIMVPAGFNWQSAHNVNFSVAITDARFQNAAHVISVYDGDPYAGGKLLSKGSATLADAFSATISIPTAIQTAYVVKTSPDNSTIVQKVSVTGSTASLSIGDKDLTVTADKGTNKAQGSGAVAVNGSPDCNSGCTVPVITTNNTNINVNSGDVVCVTGSNITIGFNANGGTIRICGSNVTVQNGNLNNNATLIVTTSGSATFSNMNLNGTATTMLNYGVVAINGSFSPGGVFQNDGTITTNGDFNMNSGSTFTNNGTISVLGTMNINTTNTSTNNGSITTKTDFTLNSSSIFVNNCTLYAKNNFNNNGFMKDYSLVKVDNITTVNSNSDCGMYNGAMLKTKDMMLNGTITGNGSTSLIKVSGNTTINSNAVVKYNIQYCAAKGIGTNNGQFLGGATQDCSVYIPQTGCNGEGNGSPAVVDSDGDGVADNLDDYPNDATKAYNNYNPSGIGTTLAFEDQWPYKGDYDLNDLVISYKYTIVTNSKNIVVQVIGNYSLLATGGLLGNGFGVEFPIKSTSLSNLKGGTQEAGQDKAVVILFSNMRNEMPQWNTVPGVAQSPIKTYSISFDVTNGPDLKTFGMDDYNPFIWNYGLKQYRGREIHLAGKTPTNLGDQTLFGTSDDNSSVAASRYYVTKTGLPYAISVPTSPFAYPNETVDITQAYLHFADWAQSGGTKYTDWYSNAAADYRKAGNIYTK